MEENSDAHMETDVSSTTDEAVDTQEVTGSSGQVEMTITVEKVNEEEATSNMINNVQIDIGNNVSSDPRVLEKSPLKTSIAQKTPDKKEDPKANLKSPAKTESLQKVTSINSPMKNTEQVSSTERKAIPADTSTKIGFLTSPTKDKNGSKEKKYDKECAVQKTAPVSKISPIIFDIDIEEKITVKTPIKKSDVYKVQPSLILKSPSKEDLVDKRPVKKAEEVKKNFHVIIPINNKGSIKSPPIKLIRKTPNREFKLQDTTVIETKVHGTTMTEKVQDVTIPSTSKNDPTIQTTYTNGETNSSKSCPKEVLSEPANLPSANIPKDVIEAEASNDSQLSTASERDHKSISRELKSLINSAKESKIISECTQLTSKTRKSRTNLDASLNVSVEAETQGDRRDSQANESDKPSLKRSMRSQNPEFVTKCKQFLYSVTSKVKKDSDDAQSDSESELSKPKPKSEPLTEASISTESSPKKKKIEEIVDDKNVSSKFRSDPYCWRCHWQLEAEPTEKQPVHPPMHCSVCVRSFHAKCMTLVERRVPCEKNWICPDCLQILHAESSETRSPAMKKISLGTLCDLLKFGLERMEALNGVEPFLQPVDRTAFPDYDKIVVHPMDLSQMRQNITDGHYGSTEAFIADAQWILHNSILFNACEQTFTQSKLTAAARALVRTCRAEMVEIETCPECYAGAHSRNLTYFTEVCSTPHMILWAKLKGFPYWPAKAVAVNNSMVDVRFFGQHDKSWVHVRDCYLYSEKDPNTTKHKKQELIQCRQEAEVHIRNICRKYGSFVYAPFKTMLDLSKMTEQLKMMIPSFTGEIKVGNDKAAPVAKARWSISKNTRNSIIDGDTSECDDTSPKLPSSRKTSDEHAPQEDTKENQEADASVSEKNTTMEIDVSQIPEPKTPVRKRRRSTFPEPAPLAESTAEKKQKVEEKPDDTITNKADQEISKDDKSELIKHAETELEGIIRKAEESQKANTDTNKGPEEPDKPAASQEQAVHRVTPIKLVALPRTNKQTPKIFTTAKVIKSNPSSPATPSTTVPCTPDEEKPLNTSSSKRSKVTKADRFIMTEKYKDSKTKGSRRNSRSNRSLTSDKTADNKSEDKKSEDTKKSDSGSDASTSKERPAKRKDDADRSLLKKDSDILKPVKDSQKETKKTDDELSLAAISRENKNSGKTDISRLPTISNVVSLSTTSERTNTSNTKTTTNIKNAGPKTIEITVEANPNSSIFTPTSIGNVGNMKEAVSKLQKLRNETTSEPFVGRVGVKAFARMTSPDINDDVEVKTEPVDEMEEERQSEKMDLMNACKLQPVTQAQSLRDVRINKVIITPTIMVRKPVVHPRAKKTFPQPKRPEGGELNGKNSMVYIPIQPPMTQPPAKSTKSGPTGATMPANVTAGPRMSAPVISTNSIVNTVTTPLRPITSTPSSAATVSAGPVSAAQVSTVTQVPTVGPTTVHTVPLMTSVNGQWMFSLQPVMSVGAVDNASSPPMVNGITERPGQNLVPVSSSANPVMPTTPANRSHPQGTRSSPAHDSNGTPKEMPRLLQRPLMSPFDASTPIGSLPPPSTAGPLTAKLNQNAVKLTDFFRTLLEDSIEKLDEPLVQVTALKVQLEQMRWRHQQSLDEIKHNYELTLSEMRQSFEKEKQRVISETRRVAQIELEAAVKQAKDKQWCANCFQEAQFYCCWNTSYCDHKCQRTHWDAHFGHCTQEKTFRQLQEIHREREERMNRDHTDANPSTVANQQGIISQLVGRDGNRRRSFSSSSDQVDKTETRPREQPLSSSHCKLPKLRGRDQRTSTNKTIIEFGEQRPWEQQPSSNKTIIELGEPRIREQQQSSNKTIIELGEPRIREQPVLTNKTIIELGGDLRSREQQMLRPPTQMRDSVENTELRSRIQKEAGDGRLPSDNPPKSVPAQTPCLTTIGGKPAPMRVFTDSSGPHKTSIIVSMVEDPNGNPTLKCVGTYKAPAAHAQAQASPHQHNIQTNDDSAKKTVTSGGYLIVGASGNTTSVITPAAAARRPQAHYFS